MEVELAQLLVLQGHRRLKGHLHLQGSQVQVRAKVLEQDLSQVRVLVLAQRPFQVRGLEMVLAPVMAPVLALILWLVMVMVLAMELDLVPGWILLVLAQVEVGQEQFQGQQGKPLPLVLQLVMLEAFQQVQLGLPRWLCVRQCPLETKLELLLQDSPVQLEELQLAT